MDARRAPRYRDPMAIHTSRFPTSLTIMATALLACGPEKSDTTADDATDSSAATTSSQPTGGGTEDSGREPLN